MVYSKRLSIAVLCLLLGEAASIDLPSTTNLAKQKDSSFLDSDVGQKMSQLSLHMLNKKAPDHPVHSEMLMRSDSVAVPIDVKLLQISEQGRALARHLMSQQDDVSAQDILAYSNVETKSDEDDNIFSSGGAIMEALEQANPGIK
jgi:hypothetical protein